MAKKGFYFCTEWIQDSNFSKGLSDEGYFYSQIYENFKENTKNQTLPFFDSEIDKLPRELSTGKMINDKNIIALEQHSARFGYKSNIYLYGAELEKMALEGTNLFLKKNAQPVLLKDFNENQTKTTFNELSISDGGTKSGCQFFYNLDSFELNSQQKILKRFQHIDQINKNITQENYRNFKQNVMENKKEANPLFEKCKQRMNENGVIKDISVSSIVNAQYKHMLLESIGKGNGINNEISVIEKNNCYTSSQKLIDSVENGTSNPVSVGQKITKALDSACWFARSCTAPLYNLSKAKAQEELIIADCIRNNSYGKDSNRNDVINHERERN